MHIKNIAALATIVGLSFSSVAAAAGVDEILMTKTAVAADTTPMTFTMPTVWVPTATVSQQSKRPAMLPALYASLGAMQAWDAFSTSTALKAGAHEANPTAAPFANNAGKMLGLKAATTAGTIFFAERMWKKNRMGAVVLLAAINGATAAVAMQNMHNARVAAGR